MKHCPMPKGKYIALLATDDLWIMDKLAHQIEVMEALPEKVGVLYSNAMQIDEAGAEIGLVEEQTDHLAC